jgi:hypothetical protein
VSQKAAPAIAQLDTVEVIWIGGALRCTNGRRGSRPNREQEGRSAQGDSVRRRSVIVLVIEAISVWLEV